MTIQRPHKRFGGEHGVSQYVGEREPDKRMRDRERVLAFFAFSHRLQSYRHPRWRFLDEETESNQNAEEETLGLFKKEFRDSLELVRKIFGAQAFKLFEAGKGIAKPNGKK